MIHFKRAKALAASTVSPMNKGVILTNASTGAASTFTLTALDPTGNSTTITFMVPINTSIVLPLYVRSYTVSGGTPSVVELN